VAIIGMWDGVATNKQLGRCDQKCTSWDDMFKRSDVAIIGMCQCGKMLPKWTNRKVWLLMGQFEDVAIYIDHFVKIGQRKPPVVQMGHIKVIAF
jgi:hypothetical protein